MADFENLSRSVRHEYTHAVVHALSKGRCPGWFDEGLAQWAEGEENPALEPALRQWLKTNDVVPLSLLQGGFTRLNPSMVPAAYAQSLFAINGIIDRYGFEAIERYFRVLRNGRADRAFVNAFGISEAEFERRLSQALRRWTSAIARR